MTNKNKTHSHLSVAQVGVMLLDYTWVVFVYGSVAFWMAVLIDGYVLPPFDRESAEKESSARLYAEVMLQIAVQGFIVLMVSTLLARLPSPVDGIAGYSHREHPLVRNPAIITVILFTLSKSLQGRLAIVFSRFDANAANIAGLHATAGLHDVHAKN